MSDYKVTGIMGSREWSPEPGKDFVYYDLQVEGQDGPVSLKTVKGQPGPKAGEVLQGDITVKDNGKRELRVPRKPGAGRSFGKSPEEQKAIIAQSAIKAAMTLLELEISQGFVPREKLQGKKASELLSPRIEWFREYIELASRAPAITEDSK